MICNECETVAHCTKHGCVPKQPATDMQANADHAVECATEAIADADGPIKAVREYYGAQPPTKEFTCSTGLCHYKAQRPWVGLTVLEQADCFANTEDATQFYHAIEAKLKEKNT